MPKPSEDSPQPEIKWLSPEDFEFLCFDLTREMMEFNEPIPDYETRDDFLLQSALASPRHTFDNELLYPTLIEQAAILFYSVIKNHPFKNGNKRIGVMALLVFLSINQKWLSLHPIVLYKVATEVSESITAQKDETLKKLEGILKNNLISYPSS